MSEVKTGSVRAYNTNLKKGLIRCDDGSADVPIYKYQLEQFGIEALRTGDKVKFEVEYRGNAPVILAIEYME